MAGRIFVTHASPDQPLAEAFVDLLRLGMGLNAEQVFASSVEGHDVPTGDRFVDYIKDQLSTTVLAVQLVSPAYVESAFCQWELGAIWFNEIQSSPLLVPPLELADVAQWNPILAQMEVGRIGTAKDLDRLYDRIRSLFGTGAAPGWNNRRARFVDDVPRIAASLPVPSRQLELERTRRRARVADAGDELHQAYHHLREAAFITLLHGADRGHLEEFRNQVQIAIDAFARAFTTVTGVPCRSCIKEVHQYEPARQRRVPQIAVTDLVRSGGMRHSRPRPDLVSANTDFEDLFELNSRYFFSNDLLRLQATGKYKNSHWRSTPPTSPAYQATIVWPIRKILFDPQTAQRTHAVTAEQHLLGFLCVDAPQPNVFDRDRDVPIGQALADTLFHVLAPWYDDMRAVARSLAQRS